MVVLLVIVEYNKICKYKINYEKNKQLLVQKYF